MPEGRVLKKSEPRDSNALIEQLFATIINQTFYREKNMRADRDAILLHKITSGQLKELQVLGNSQPDEMDNGDLTQECGSEKKRSQKKKV